MKHETAACAGEVCQSYVANGVRLEIIATRIDHSEDKPEWALAVVNEAGISSNWMEPFASSEAALAAALKAINENGIDDFASTEGFDYLHSGDIE